MVSRPSFTLHDLLERRTAIACQCPSATSDLALSRVTLVNCNSFPLIVAVKMLYHQTPTTVLLDLVTVKKSGAFATSPGRSKASTKRCAALMCTEMMLALTAPRNPITQYCSAPFRKIHPVMR